MSIWPHVSCGFGRRDSLAPHAAVAATQADRAWYYDHLVSMTTTYGHVTANPADYAHDVQRENKFGFTFATNGFLRLR